MNNFWYGSSRCLVVVLIGLQCACTPVRPDSLAQPDKSRLGRVGIAVGKFEPQYKFEALTGGKGEGGGGGGGGGDDIGAKNAERAGGGGGTGAKNAGRAVGVARSVSA